MSRRPPEGDEDPSSTSSRRQTRRSSRSGASISAAEPTSSLSTARTGLTQPHPPLISSNDPVASSSSSSLGVGAGRAPREATARRASRRASLDPYPTGLGESPEAARGTRRASRATTGDQERHGRVEEEQEDVGMQAGEGEGRRAPTDTATAGRPRTYELVIMQQPRVGAEAGMGRSTVGRLPLVPAPIVEVIVRDERGRRTDVDLPYLLCTARLMLEDGLTRAEVAQLAEVPNGEDAETFSTLVGSPSASPRRVEDLEGRQRNVFVFEDLAVRVGGTYRLEFRLEEIPRRLPTVRQLASTVSQLFDVVEWADYPGIPPSEVVTQLSMHLHQQGVPMYIPPLILPQPDLPPPPAGSNPFPPEDPRSGRPHTASNGDTPPPANSPSP
ncbi:RHTO0S01e15632g2_1 [Rhodotorula toruloides]|uniref:RHTO0S01e15632g2_1 n=1 Tax=Rhodotorula toruloides TaxID=5286 RepID=A0A061AGA5_RHOTO|nr:RHTO0S01e15632g2_1 [Rhodotorula toruloides]